MKVNREKVWGVLFVLVWLAGIAMYSYERDWRAVILMLAVGAAWATVLYLLSLLDRKSEQIRDLVSISEAQAGRNLDDAKTIFDLGSRDRAREKVFEQGTTALIGHPEVIDRILRFVAPHQRGSFIRISEAGDLRKLQGHRLVGVILLDGHDTIDQTWPGLSKYVYSRVG